MGRVALGVAVLGARYGLASRRLYQALGRRLVEERRFVEADDVLRRGLARFPADLDLIARFAWSAETPQGHDVAIDRWRNVLAVRPDFARAWERIAAHLRETRRVDEAFETITEAMARIPDDPLLLAEAIRIFEARGSSADALALWQRATELFPDRPIWRQGHVEALAHLGRLDEAEAVLETARMRFPGCNGLLLGAGLVAIQRGRFEEALSCLDRYESGADRPQAMIESACNSMAELAARLQTHHPEAALVFWCRLLQRDPARGEWLDGRIDTLVALGRLEQAEQDIVRARAIHPEHGGLWRTHGTLEMKRERWDAAIELLRAHSTRHPDDEFGRELLGRAVMERNYAAERRAAPDRRAPRPHDVGRVEDDGTREILLGFESLGEDCEFGLVQRRYGAEPFGLFRWNTVEAPSLIDALGTRLEGLGEPENTELRTFADDEYYVADRRWGFGLHTYLTKHEVDREVLFEKMCRRIVYLSGKFLADLESAERVFVFKSANMRLPELRALHAALRAIGPARLVCVKPAASSARLDIVDVGRAYAIERDLFVGYLSHDGNGGDGWNIAFDDWVSICGGIGQAAALPAGVDGI